jgi:YggT family protein
VVLLLRILLLALGANSDNGIVDGIYGVTEPFVAPFRGIFTLDEIRPVGRSVFDIAALVALIGWVLIELLILAVLKIGDRDRVAA